MKWIISVALCVAVFFALGCSTSSLSRKEIERLSTGMNFVTIPASVPGTSKDVKVHYIEAGDPGAPAMILIHGFASSTLTWKDCVPELAKYYHVYAIDMPGFGYSDKFRDFPYGPEGYGKVVVEFMDLKGIDKAVVGGNSMGGGVSAWLAMNRPERLTHLVLIDAAGYPMETPGLVSLAQKQWLKPIIKPFYGKFIVGMGLKQVYYDDSKVTPEWIELYGRPFKTANGKDVPFWVFEKLGEEDWEAQSVKIPTIKIPTLIIWGENDTWIPLEHAHMFNRDIEGSKLVIIPECGHVPEEEKPDVVVAAILEFLGH